MLTPRLTVLLTVLLTPRLTVLLTVLPQRPWPLPRWATPLITDAWRSPRCCSTEARTSTLRIAAD